MNSWRVMLRILRTCLLITGLLFLFSNHSDAETRPGGGHGYSGGGSSGGYSGGSSGGSYSGSSSSSSSYSYDYSGGSGGSGDSGPLSFIMAGFFIVLIILSKVKSIRERLWSKRRVYLPKDNRDSKVRKQLSISRMIQSFREADPDFSETLFLDFAQELFTQFHERRTQPDQKMLKPFFRHSEWERLQKMDTEPVQVSKVVIGSLNIQNIQVREQDEIMVLLDANYSVKKGNRTTRYWVLEHWLFRRRQGTKSLAPEKTHALGCPNCGSAEGYAEDSYDCLHCGTQILPGDWTWEVVAVNKADGRVLPPYKVEPYAPEIGTNWKKIKSPTLSSDIAQFNQFHSLESNNNYFEEMEERTVKPYFKLIYGAWGANEWETARPLMTDHLFRMHHFWIEEYAKKKVYNRLDDLKVKKVELVKLNRDQYYETAVFYIKASVKDYIQHSTTKQVLAGNNRKSRLFAEYWTFVRRTGVEKDIFNQSADTCPNCSAPVKMSTEGICAHCETKVSTGRFGWILSRITQDEVYYG